MPYATELTSKMLSLRMRSGTGSRRHPVAPCGMEAAVHEQKGWPAAAILQTVMRALRDDIRTFPAVRILPDAPARCCSEKIIHILT